MIRTLLRLMTVLAAVAVTGAAAAPLPAPWVPVGPFGGRTPSLATDPVHPGTVYAIAAGTVFKTVDGALSWKRIYTGTVVSNLAIDPVHPGTLYAGAIGPILIKSTDGGAHWAPSAGGLIPDPSFVPRIAAVDPVNPRRLLLSYAQGLWRSADAGASWRPANAGLPEGAGTFIDAIAISSAAAFVITPAGIYRSGDGGVSWAPAGGGLPTAPADAIAVAPSDPRTVYAALQGEGLYQSRDGGASWRLVAGPGNLTTQSLTVSPLSPRTLYAVIGGQPMRSRDGGAHWSLLGALPAVLDLESDSRGTVYAGTAGIPGGVFRSDDGGETWTRRIQGLTAVPTLTLVVDPSDPERIWASGNAVYRTADGGARWVRVPGPDPRSFHLGGPLAIGAGSQVFAKAGRALWTADRNGSSWRKLLGSPEIDDLLALQVAPSNLSTVYAAGIDLFDLTKLYRSTDRGATWQLRSSGSPLPQRREGCDLEDLAVAPSNAGVVYVATGSFSPVLPQCPSKVIRSDDGGATWSVPAAGPPVGIVSRIAVDPQDPKIVYAGTGGGSTPGDGLWKSTDGGVTWARIDQGFRVKTLTALLASAIPGRVYAATFGQVFRSDDGGATWRTRSRALGTETVFELVADPGDPHRIYAATANGVWRLDERD